MKCPTCGYQHGWDGPSNKDVKGEHGNFYALPINVVRKENWMPDEQKPVYACPSPTCGIMFAY